MAYINNSIARVQNGVLYIKKRRQSQWILLIVMLWPFVLNLLSAMPKPLNYAQYLCDGIMMCWCISGLVSSKRKKIKLCRDTLFLIAWIGLFFVYTLFAYSLNYQSVAYYLWGLRNNFRPYVLFIYVLTKVDLEELESWFETLDVLFWINAVLAVIQFVFFRVKQDMLGGIFGTQAGTNGFMLIFLSVVVTRSQIKFSDHEETLSKCLLKCCVALLVAAMAELKFLLLLFVFQLVLVVVLTSFSWKKVIFIPLGLIAASFAMQLLAQWFSSSGTFDIERVIEKAFQQNYATSNDLNRLSAIGTLSRTIVQDPLDRLIGLGLGNCDSATFSFLRTPFYERYAYLHYRYFSAPMMFLETGYIGLSFFLGFFIVCLSKFLENRKNREKIGYYNSMGIIFAVTALLLAFYNASLRYEGGWMIYIVLASPFISARHAQLKG